MTRNYKGEAEWERNNYTRLQSRLKKELADEFKLKLESDNISYSAWLLQHINEYLGEIK